MGKREAQAGVPGFERLLHDSASKWTRERITERRAGHTSTGL